MVREFSAILLDPKDDSEVAVATVAADDEGRLTQLRTTPGYDGVLDDVINELNAKDTIRVRTPAKQKFAITTERFERSHPGIVEAVRRYASHYYGLELRDAAAVSEQFEDLT